MNAPRRLLCLTAWNGRARMWWDALNRVRVTLWRGPEGWELKEVRRVVR